MGHILHLRSCHFAFGNAKFYMQIMWFHPQIIHINIRLLIQVDSHCVHLSKDLVSHSFCFLFSSDNVMTGPSSVQQRVFAHFFSPFFFKFVNN